MLYKYPYLRLEVNKLHTYVCLFIRNLRTTKRKSFHIDICPPELTQYVKRSGVLKSHLEKFTNIYLKLDEVEQKKVFEVFVNNNAIEALLEGKRSRVNCSIEDLSIKIQDTTYKLFKFMFEDTLKLDNKLKIHYKKLYEIIKRDYKKICPFCGIESLVHPDKGMQDYDHLLYKKKYPLSGINMRNLVPMGEKCNRRYKKTTDIILDDSSGKNRKFFYPFNDIPPIRIDLTNSPVPKASDNWDDWVIEFKPRMEEIESWATIFDIRSRYKLDIFEVGFFNTWLSEFKNHAFKYGKASKWDFQSVKEELKEYLADIDRNDFRTLGFMKYAIFEFLLLKAPDDYFEDLALEIAA